MGNNINESISCLFHRLLLYCVSRLADISTWQIHISFSHNYSTNPNTECYNYHLGQGQIPSFIYFEIIQSREEKNPHSNTVFCFCFSNNWVYFWFAANPYSKEEMVHLPSIIGRLIFTFHFLRSSTVSKLPQLWLAVSKLYRRTPQLLNM